MATDSVLAVGVDLVEINRIAALVERYGERFTRKIFTARELTESGQRPESLAARWAAKEATAKALGTGIGKVAWTDIEVICDPCADVESSPPERGLDSTGRPVLRLTGQAAALAEGLGLTVWAVSLAHDGGLALAFVVALHGPGSPYSVTVNTPPAPRPHTSGAYMR